MNETKFSELNLRPEIQQAVEALGFETATPIQAQSIPLIRSGQDVIGRSQTGTGKTLAFGIPALESINPALPKGAPQALILCPTRELAQQACEELKKLSRFLHGVRTAEIYGGASMDRQIVRLKNANIVVGTPGRIMDHMRRKTLKLHQIRMVVLDEADEMLSMGFKEDIETILTDTPEDRQTILFSATMPPAIMKLTREFQKDPALIEINRQNITLEQISQYFIDAPMGRKMDALNLLLHFHQPNLAMVFCNTKKMVDEVTEYLLEHGFSAAGLHGDMNQSQRTKTLEGFKSGRTTLLVATDVAARGIDVSGIDYVINYDIPQNTEYYVHRIGRTGRAGKPGSAITICSGRRQVYTLRDIARAVKSDIRPIDIPTLDSIRQKSAALNQERVSSLIREGVSLHYQEMVNSLLAEGHPLPTIAAAALELCFGKPEKEIVEIKAAKRSTVGGSNGSYRKIVLSAGRSQRIAPNHIVGAIAERTGISGGEIGKIEIYDDRSLVGIPSDQAEEVLRAMQGCKICGKPVSAFLLEERSRPSQRKENGRAKPDSRKYYDRRNSSKSRRSK